MLILWNFIKLHPLQVKQEMALIAHRRKNIWRKQVITIILINTYKACFS